MIHYQLRCGAAHEFEAWFRDSAAYEEQAGAGLLQCPHCGERQVVRALMAPALPRRRRRAAAPVAETAAEAAPPNAHQPDARQPDARPPDTRQPDARPADAAPAEGSGRAMSRMPDQLRALLQRMRSEIEQRCDYVGGGFAAEARRIHDGETAKRGIYGEATPEEAEALAEDGIAVAQIPWLPRADA